MTGSRERVLARVRAALADVPADERPEDVAVVRDYDRAHAGGGEAELFELLADRLVDYRASVREVAVEPGGDAGAAVGAAVAELLAGRGAGRLLLPPGVPADWTGALPDGAPALLRDDGLAVAELDRADAVLTGCAVAIAETGTIVLDGGPAQGRRALSLVPDRHLCVVLADQVVASVPQALARLDPSRPLTWISGPSATSDIELDRVEGVHGPRTLDVLLVRTG
ncbi:LutC/YkgG family protein [Allonocardiopsis opalescens]|uniref:L-lactate dehydrogenase complex protein LldG n=1 Tax=Allonocardiopsis opalescens TaxID=1144618 RepID=A0A2T0QCK9_9ACTN|nr:LUD domain-containing protein [Allonocardiopsis opalescens]PRY01684.1 L-lactate dehydrogenase complex protein LldG [Allonocardiopsis opalescens]